MQVDDAKKQESLDVAEDSRHTDWEQPSFVADLFKGEFAWDHIHPFPLQTPEDKKIGDDYMAKLKPILEEHIDPSDVDRTRDIPQAAIDALKEAGAFGMKVPKEYGGLGLSQTNYSRVCGFIGSYCSSTGAWITAHQSIGVAGPLKMFGTKEQKDKYLPQIAKGAISAFGLTEPNVGSDPAKMETYAELSEDGSHYIVNGDKLWITNGPVADIMILMARTKPIMKNGKEKQQITAFVFETKDAEGYEVVHRCDFMGIRGIQNGLLRFKNVKIPAENVIGKTGDGLKIALITLVNGRLSIPATAGAGGKRALSYSKGWAAKREQWGAPIGKHQNTAIKLARFASNTFASEAITWLCCNFADEGHMDIRIEAAMAKYFCTENSCATADDFLQIRGGRGYETAESLAMRGEDPVPAERFVRDARISRIVEGTSEIMRLYIAREAMDTHLRQILPLMIGKDKVGHLMKSFLPFYMSWYPKQWMPSFQTYKVDHLNATNQDHLAYIGRAAKRLARTMFHTMAKYQQKLEREQIVMTNFVDIGTDLFAMAATLSYGDAYLGRVEDKQAVQEMVDLFCCDARQRIETNFKAVKKNHNRKYDNVARHAMAGKYEFFCDGVYDDIPPGYLKYMNKSIDAYNERHGITPEAPAHEEAAKEEQLEPVAK